MAGTRSDGVEDALDTAKETYTDTKDFVEGNNTSSDNASQPKNGTEGDMPGKFREKSDRGDTI